MKIGNLFLFKRLSKYVLTISIKEIMIILKLTEMTRKMHRGSLLIGSVNNFL